MIFEVVLEEIEIIKYILGLVFFVNKYLFLVC